MGLLLTCEHLPKLKKGKFLTESLVFLQGVAFTWLVTGIVLARRNHIPILVPDDRYFRSAFGQASLVVILLVSGFQLVSSICFTVFLV